MTAVGAKLMETEDAWRYIIGRLQGLESAVRLQLVHARAGNDISLGGIYAAVSAVEEARLIHRSHLEALAKIMRGEQMHEDEGE